VKVESDGNNKPCGLHVARGKESDYF